MRGRARSYHASNDVLIDELVKDPRYQVKPDGSVYRLSGNVWKETGKAITDKNGKSYRHLKYQGRNLLVHRIVFRRFKGRLSAELVINHIDGDSLNNRPGNLELISQQENAQHAHTPDSY